MKKNQYVSLKCYYGFTVACVLHDRIWSTNKNCPEEKQTLDFKMTSLQPE